MAYIYFNGEKYFPFKDFDNDLLDLCSDRTAWFSVDELMALPVAALNNKGYFTEMSCSGHSIGNLFCKLADEADIAQFKKEGTLIAVRRDDESNVDYMYWVDKQIANEIFIIFKKSECFSCIPSGWKYQHSRRRLSFGLASSNNPMSIYREISIALETLMAWIEELPDVNG